MLKPTISSLRTYSQVVSIEALSVNRTSAPLLRKLNTFVAEASTYVKEQLTSLNPLRHDIGFSKIEKRLQNNTYDVVRNIEIPVPAGMSVSYLEYIQMMRDAQQLVIGLYDDTLRPFSIFVGACINDPERTQQLINSHSVKISDLEPIRKKMGDCTKNGSKATLPFGKVVARNADWSLIESNTKALVGAQKQISTDLITNTIAEIDEKLTILVSRMSDTNEKYRPTPTLIKDLSELTYMLAEKVTFYAVYTAQYNAFTIAMDHTVETLAKKLKV